MFGIPLGIVISVVNFILLNIILINPPRFKIVKDGTMSEIPER
jgi:hypothetical protein